MRTTTQTQTKTRTRRRVDDEERYRPADRFALQQSWWIASEIARRHGGLLISRVQDDDFNSILLVHDGPVGNRVQFDLAAGATWKTLDGDLERLSWREMLEYDNAHTAVKHLEENACFGTPTQAAVTNRRTIAYRLAAALLTAKIDDRHTWQIVPAPLASGETEMRESLALLEPFASTGPQIEYAFTDMAELYEQSTLVGRTPYWHEPLWLVLKDLETAMVLDESGYVHLADGVFLDLMDLYRALGRDIGALAGVALMSPDHALEIADRIVPEAEG